MRALTLQQPYATLGVLGLKEWETRSRPTKHRGEHLITSSASPQPQYMALTREWIYVQQIDANPGLEVGKLPFAMAIGKATITDCVPTDVALDIMKKEVADGKLTREQMEMNIAFGDFGPRRFAYRWANPVELEKPVPISGALGIFETSRIKGNYSTRAVETVGLQGYALYYLGEFVESAPTLAELTDLQAMLSDIEPRIYDIEKRLFNLK